MERLEIDAPITELDTFSNADTGIGVRKDAREGYDYQIETDIAQFPDELPTEYLSDAKGRRKACKAKGLKGKAFRKCVRELRKADKGKSKSELRQLKKDRKKEWKSVKKEVKQKWRDEGKGFFRKAWRGFAKINPAVILMRQSFRLLLNLNVWDMSNKIYRLEEAAKKGNTKAQRALQTLKTRWAGWGGNPDKIIMSARSGQMKKPIIIRFRKKKGFDGLTEWWLETEDDGSGYSNDGGATAGAATAAAASSTPIIVSVASILASVSAIVGVLPLNKEDAEGIEESALQTIDDNPEFTDEQKQMLAANMENELEEAEEAQQRIMGVPKTTFYIGASVLAAGIIGLVIYAATRKK